MTRVLLLKEIRQHALVFGVLLVLNLAGAFLVGRATWASGNSGSVFVGAGAALISFLSLTAAILSHRLVVLEFQTKTTLFLEGLPLPRWRMLAVKFVLGWLLLLACAGAILFVPWMLSVSEQLTPHALTILLSRALTWASFVYAFFFLTGFLGRYRIPVYLFLGYGLMWLAFGTQLRVGQFPPFTLIDPNHFAFEREVFPRANLIWTGGLSVALVAIALGLGLIRDGSVASMLGERMSHRERLFIGGAFWVFAMIPLILDHHRKAPFDLPGALEEEHLGIRLLFSPENLDRPVDRELFLASSLTESLARERDWFEIAPEDWPPIFIVERSDFEPEERPYTVGSLDKDEGCLVYADYRRPEFPDEMFSHFLTHQCLRVYARDRIDREQKRWVFEGFFALRELQSATEETRTTWEERARLAHQEHPFSPDALRGWDRYESQLGNEPARALAWHFLATLQSELGDEPMRQFLISVLGPPVSGRDVRAVFQERLHPLTGLFHRAAGLSLEAFFPVWEASLNLDAPPPKS